MIGITINKQHSWKEHKLRILQRSIGMPPKDEHKEHVPYSNITEDFGMLYGKPTYGERTLVYKFEFLCMNRRSAQSRLDDVFSWLSYTGKTKLYDELCGGYYFEAECTGISYTEDHGIYTITATFKASPFRYPIVPKLPYDPTTYPDLDGDGAVTSADAAIIMTAATAISAGNASGLTPEQEVLADADRDGAVTVLDAAIVLEFATATSVGTYANTPEGWAEFMNDKTSEKEGIL